MAKEIKTPVRDFIYFDFEKAASIFSQISGGYITGIETRAEESKDESRIQKFDLKIFKPESGKVEGEKNHTFRVESSPS